ncbi:MULTISPECIES: CoA-binding protein [unclassified Rhodococcus (in: high G+C Gram-positive bacteria)]|uniref:CoA-binding protein n=1 Tax=unclassified Rhodococcus (in: high G+C Gram-positive bacteria) TaxID=192944 RepID=UPI00163A8618|nr:MULTISPECIES: CoA-binding protein [unclassified Rhodococcus (in: high G+C Gram-positive bacteria)]MBC2637578.1 CoA-binding protein [Rhodococcus sp. 3A]MBC2644285.1 CoA-binding protein [Rhodococcus sp. 3A]MBC2890979.1 CoA-binding protein [Rhodococcus sp. 4CII]MBC2897676.1 CoA-binding protein [Rhodococcus sp. 4CII]
MAADPLTALLRPSAVAVVGASSDPASYASRPLRYLLDAGFTGRLAAVNPRRTETMGVPTYPTITDIPFVPDVALILVNAALVPATLLECAKAGVPFAISVASGFGEAGNSVLDDEVRRICTGSGLRLLGPNCIGALNNIDNVPLTFSTVIGQMPLSPGPLAVVAQSGALTNVVLQTCACRGLGIGYAVTSGNELDLEWGELALAVLEQSETRVLLGYVEAFKNPETAREVGRRARELDKTVIVTKSGRSAAGAAASRSHTGKIAGDGQMWEAVANEFGLLPAASLDELVDIAEVRLAELAAVAGRDGR